MWDAFIGGLLINLQLKSFLYMLIGCAIGFWVGILPGIGGGTTLALMMPFIYKMTPQEAFPFLLGMHSVVATTGDITSVLFGIPGEATTVATIVDGYPMAKKGEAGRALGAVLMSSLIGALFGATFLAFTIPIVRPLVLAFGSPEMFMLIILGLTCISTLSGHGKRGLLLGLMSGGFGFLVSLVGQDRQAGILRFTFGQLYLWNGLSIIPVMVGLFAIPEIVDLAVRGTAIAGNVQLGKLGKGVREGIKDTFRHFWLTVRCSLIGSLIGILPGLGGGVAQWVSYAHATQSAKTEEERAGFRQGRYPGGPGSGGGQQLQGGAGLIPTVAFGIPAGSGMAILMGAFFLLGLVPGPGHADEASHPDLLHGLDDRHLQRHHRGGLPALHQSPRQADHDPGKPDDPHHPSPLFHRGLYVEQRHGRSHRLADLRRRSGISWCDSTGPGLPSSWDSFWENLPRPISIPLQPGTGPPGCSGRR